MKKYIPILIAITIVILTTSKTHAAISYDTGTNGFSNYPLQIVTVSSTVGSSNEIGIINIETGNGDQFLSLTWNGTDITSNLINKSRIGGYNNWSYQFYMTNPPTGTHNVIATCSAACGLDMTVDLYTGVDQVTPIGTTTYTTSTNNFYVTWNTTTTINNVWLISSAFHTPSPVTAATGTTYRNNSMYFITTGDSGNLTTTGSYPQTYTWGSSDINTSLLIAQLNPSGGTPPITPEITLTYPLDQTQYQSIGNFVFQIHHPTTSAVWVQYQQVATSTPTSTFTFGNYHATLPQAFFWNPSSTDQYSLNINIPLGGNLGNGYWMAQAFMNYGSSGTIAVSPINLFQVNFNAPPQGATFLGIPLAVTTSSLLVGQNFAFYGTSNTSTQNCSLPSSSYVDCAVQFLVNNTIGTLFIPQGNIVGQLSSTTSQFQNVFPFNLYFGIIGGVEQALIVGNTTTSQTLPLNIVGLHGETINIITITSSTLLNALTTHDVTSQFGTTTGCNQSCAQDKINIIKLIMGMGIWLTAGIKIIGIIIAG